MNERIKELYNVCNEFDSEEMEYNFNYVKFAQLIVRECATLCINEGRAHEQWFGSHCAITVKKHFGVEEQEKVAPKPRCSVCGTTENVMYMGGYQPYLCDSVDCIPF